MMPLAPLALGAVALLLARPRAKRLGPVNLAPARARAVQTIAPAADAATRAAGAPGLLPLAIAQAMLESGWGRATPGNNWYGIKGNGPAGTVNVPTREEFRPGEISRIRANFRAYSDATQSVADWLRFVTGGRYAPARDMSPGGAALWIWANGYATATHYVDALARTANTVARATGLPHLAIELTPAQRQVALALSALPARDRRAVALKMRQEGTWPS